MRGTTGEALRGIALTACMVVAGCSTLSPAQSKSLDEVRAFADDTARVYSLHPIHVLVSHNPESPVGSFRRGFFAVNELVLRSEFRDAIVARAGPLCPRPRRAAGRPHARGPPARATAARARRQRQVG